MNIFKTFTMGVLALGMLGCSTVLTGTMKDSDGGNLTLDVNLSPAFMAYWADLRTADPTLPASPLSEPALRQSFSKISGIKTWSLESLKAGQFRLKFSFDQGQQISDQISGKEVPLLSWTTSGTEKKLTFRLSQTALQSLIQTTGLADSSSLEVFLAGGEGELTKDEYTELLSYFLESYDPRAKATVAASFIEVNLEFPRNPTKVVGGKIQGRVANFRASLVDVLLLEKPLIWEVSY